MMSNNGEEQLAASTAHKRTSRLKIVGRVLSERHVANMKREILLLADAVEDGSSGDTGVKSTNNNANDKTSQAKEYRVRLHAEENEGVSRWMTIKKARQLICRGVLIQVEGWLESIATDGNVATTSNDTSDNGPDKATASNAKHMQSVVATAIQVVSALPTNTYLATLLSFTLEDLSKLFPKTDSSDPQAAIKEDLSMTSNSLSLPPGVLVACCTNTISPSYLEDVATFCRSEKLAGRADKLWNSSKVKDLVQSLRDHHEAHGSLTLFLDNDSKKHGQLPRTSKRTWKSLTRLEDKWLCPKRDGEIGDYDYDMPTHSYRTKRKHDGSEHEVVQQSSASSNIRAQQILSSSTASTINMVEHVRNLPDQQDARRLRYIDQRKQPQVRCMLDFINRLLQRRETATNQESANNGAKSGGNKTNYEDIGDGSYQNLHLIEIGGGRGYLAHEVAAFYKTRQKMLKMGAPSCHVTVVDNNERSLQAGKIQAEQAGLMDCMSFVLCDLNDEQQVETNISTTQGVDLVFGLHCCGGLAEAAVELALKSKVGFCISTCCFRSIPSLASLTQLAVRIWAREEAKEDKSTPVPPTLVKEKEKKTEGQLLCQLIQQHQQQIDEDMARVASLAVNVGAKGQHRAIRVCNAMRLSAAETRFAERATSAGSLCVWQEAFPVEYSVQNRVLMGLII